MREVCMWKCVATHEEAGVPSACLLRNGSVVSFSGGRRVAYNTDCILWQKGYQNGELLGHVYDDVPVMLENWNFLGKKMGIFSSGSVNAQKLLFSHSVKGNLSTYFSNYFDTNIGSKRDSDTYSLITKILALPSNRILFLSDVIEELAAAEKVGMKTIQIKREGNMEDWKQSVADFSEIVLI